jgi:hypothetical protein
VTTRDAKKPSEKKKLEMRLIEALLAEGDIPPWHNAPSSSHYQFNKPDNAMQFDIAWPEYRVAIEVNGGQWSSGKMGHNSGTGIERDARKNNWAILKDWKLIILVTDHIKRDMVTYTIPLIRRVLGAAGAPLRDYERELTIILTQDDASKWITKEEDDEETDGY